MKKATIIIGLMLLVVSVFAADRASTDDYSNGSAYYNPSGLKNAPGTRRIYLTDNDALEATDTISADEEVIYGPYKFSVGEYAKIPDGFFLTVPTLTIASGDSINVAWQPLPDTSIADTITTWNVVDTVTSTGLQKFITLDSTIATHLLFRVHNLDGTEVQISNPISVILRERRD